LSEWLSGDQAVADGSEERSHDNTGFVEPRRGFDYRTDIALERFPLLDTVRILVERRSKRIGKFSREDCPASSEGFRDCRAKRLAVEREVLGERCHVP
jgi:hypothetical protein